MDKTGTLTRGPPEVTDVIPLDGASPDDLLALAAAVDRESEHPLARAVVRAAERRHLALPSASGFTAIPGKGGRAVVGKRTIRVRVS